MDLNKLIKFYKNKKVLVLGHTGFKGSWLTLCLKDLKSKIYGISIDIPTTPSHFKQSAIEKNIKDIRIDIRNYNMLKKRIEIIKPDIIFHCAAQSLVKESFKDPLKTWTTNLIGTINILEILKNLKLKKNISVVIVTSDKCYKNLNQKKGYVETDLLGDNEPYGSSKAAVELAFQSYFHSFLKKKKNLSIATARAGNVIGGGDWSKDRIIPDVIRSLKSKKYLKIRYPNSTRPWQHVLEPIYGYLFLGYKLYKNLKNTNGQSFNFGPKFIKNYKVVELLFELKKYFPKIKWKVDKKTKKIHEAGLLNLNCNKAYEVLKWKNILNFETTLQFTSEWYNQYLKKKKIESVSLNQIEAYKKKLEKQA